MRSPPSPALQNVLVARPGTNPSSVVRRDDLLAAAALAADEREPRRRSVLALVHRRFARFSESLRRRRSSTPASQAAAALAATDTPFYAIERNEVVAAYERERVRQAVDPESAESHEMRDEASVSSSRDPAGNSRRVKQFGAKDDDDTLLMLPRVASVSFTSPDSESRARSHAPRVRQLPRMKGLMPTRAPRRLVAASPVSSDGRASASEEGDRASNGSYSDEYDDGESDEINEEGDQEQADDDEDDATRRHGLHRLPTGLTNIDVEQAMKKAVVEIASDGDSDPGASLDSPIPKRDQKKLSGEARAGEVRISTSGRSRSEAHQNRPRQNTDESQVIAAFSRRISSSTHTYSKRHMFSENDPRPSGNEDHKIRFHKAKDYTLFEDDYLSFQGFHGQSESRSHQGMSALLRSRRISSITDSHSENSDDITNVRSVASSDSRRKQTKTSSLLSSVLFHKRHVSQIV